MNSISEKLTDAIIKKKLIPLEMRDWYIYAFLRILETSLSTITVLIIGYMESKIVPTICFWLFFCELRKQTGGFHCKKYWECYLVTSLLMYIYINIEKYVSACPIMIYLCLIISAIVIMYIGSINNPNMNLSKNEIRALKEKARYTLGIELFVIVSLIYIGVEFMYVAYMTFAILTCAILLMVAKITKQEV